ncbi:MAG: NUDIX domain-containing protein [Mangrovibacterium sp.]
MDTQATSSPDNPATVFSYCPRCGSDRFCTIGIRSKKCSRCGFHYFFNTSAAVAALIFDKKDRLLLTRRAVEPYKGQLDLPGGFIDPGESAEEALRRELKEELGVEPAAWKYLGSFPNTYPYSGFNVYTVDLAFAVNIKTPELMTPMDDIASFAFYEPSSVDLRQLPSASIKRIVRGVINNEFVSVIIKKKNHR